MNINLQPIRVLILVLLITPFSQAVDLELPLDIERQKVGYDLYPVIQCPRPQKKYDDLLAKLGSIKEQIKKEACRQDQVDKIKEVESLETLVTSGRIEFIDLLKKGTSGESELTQAEVDKLRDYVDNVVKKAAVITGLANNPACFNEDEKVSTLSLLSSLVGEVAGALGAIPGPLGAKIGLGGKLAAGLLSSIDTIVQARKTYEYDKYEDQKNYLNNLCAYYEFKGDLDKETDTGTVSSELEDLIISSEKLLERLDNECSECRAIIADFEGKLDSNEPYSFTLGNDAEGGRVLTKSLEEMTWMDLKEYYLSSVSVADTSVDVEEGKSGPGTHTIRTLRTKTWAEEELISINDLDESGLPEGGRREVMRVQDQIEGFLVDREGPRYVRHYDNLINKDMRNLETVARAARYELADLQLQPDPNYQYDWRNNLVDTIHDIFREDIDFANIINSNMTSDQAQSLVRSAKDQVRRAIHAVRIDYSVLNYQCYFFQYSRLRYKGPVGYQCQNSQNSLQYMKDFFLKLEDTSYGARNAYTLEVFKEKPKKYTRNWVESTTKVLNYMAEKPNLVEE